MRRLTALLTVLLIAACGLPSTAQIVRILGRSVGKPADFSVQWPAAGFEAKFEGTTFEATIADGGDTSFEVDVDGAKRVLMLAKGSKPYTLFRGAKGAHVIRLTRRTGPNSGPTQFSGFRSDGPIGPTQSEARRVMFVGDSITTGFGVGGPDQTCPFSYATEIATDAYAVLTARTLGADLQVIAVDGAGLVKNYDGGTQTMRTAVWRAAPWDEARAPVEAWQPQAVVVNLGTNDMLAGVSGADFSAGYTGFLAELRRAYPGALIVAAIGPLLDDAKIGVARQAIAKAVGARKAAGDNNVQQIQFSLARSGRIYGCSWHPGLDTQRGMALALSEALARSLGWSTMPTKQAPPGSPR